MKATLNNDLFTLVSSFRNYSTFESGGTDCKDGCSQKASTRISRAMAWKLFYTAKEAGLPTYEVKYINKSESYPSGFQIGTWGDGSAVSAVVTYDPINGPYWVSFPIYLNEPTRG